MDYTHLNKFVTRERYQLPTAEEIFARLKGAKYFSTLDACSGFWQIPLSEDSSKLTTFLTPHGRFQFTRLPFGLNSGPEVFHRAMRMILDGLDGVECYIDDVLIWADTKEKHDERLQQVLERCKENGLQLNAAKCQFRVQQVKYFGHILTKDGILPDDSKIEALTAMAPPKTKEELRRFNGMVTYLAKFIPNLSEATGPLRELLKESSEWVWGPPQQKAFGNLKQLLTSPRVLAYYNSDQHTIVSADASSYGIGAVLLQVQQDGRRAPIAYVSRALTDTEKRYPQIEKEALAITWGCERFAQYLMGGIEPFTVETLLTILNTQDFCQCPPRLQGLKMRLVPFHYRVEFVPGKQLLVADALSRAPVETENDTISEEIEMHLNMVTIAGIPASLLS